jgi:hypothetical protein
VSAPAAAARLAEDAFALRGAALSLGGLVWPSDAYELLGSLDVAVERLRQTVDHVAAFLRDQATRPGLVDDSDAYRDRPGDAITDAVAVLAAANVALGRSAELLDGAQQRTAGLAVKAARRSGEQP